MGYGGGGETVVALAVGGVESAALGLGLLEVLVEGDVLDVGELAVVDAVGALAGGAVLAEELLGEGLVLGGVDGVGAVEALAGGAVGALLLVGDGLVVALLEAVDALGVGAVLAELRQLAARVGREDEYCEMDFLRCVSCCTSCSLLTTFPLAVRICFGCSTCIELAPLNFAFTSTRSDAPISSSGTRLSFVDSGWLSGLFSTNTISDSGGDDTIPPN